MDIQEESVIIFIHLASQVGPQGQREKRSIDFYIFKLQYQSRADEVFTIIGCSNTNL